jgi:hypothetical protein
MSNKPKLCILKWSVLKIALTLLKNYFLHAKVTTPSNVTKRSLIGKRWVLPEINFSSQTPGCRWLHSINVVLSTATYGRLHWTKIFNSVISSRHLVKARITCAGTIQQQRRFLNKTFQQHSISFRFNPPTTHTLSSTAISSNPPPQFILVPRKRHLVWNGKISNMCLQISHILLTKRLKNILERLPSLFNSTGRHTTLYFLPVHINQLERLSQWNFLWHKYEINQTD